MPSLKSGRFAVLAPVTPYPRFSLRSRILAETCLSYCYENRNSRYPRIDLLMSVIRNALWSHYVGYVSPLLPLGKNKRVMNIRRLWVVACLCAMMLSCRAQAKQIAVVVDNGNDTSNLSAGELAKIFNIRTQSWPDGKPITVVLHDPFSSDMQLVLRKILNITPEQARALIHNHPGAIVIADTDDAVIHFVSTTRGAIGVIDLYSLTKDVKVLKVDGKLPVEPGYLLKGN